MTPGLRRSTAVAFLLLDIFFLSFRLSSGVVFTESQENDLRSFIQRVMSCKKIPGLTLAVVKGNETWTSGFGVADMVSATPVTEETLFAIGSLAKSFTMTVLGMTLWEHGFDWNTKLQDIPNTNYKFINENLTREATVADLLSHQTGLSTVPDIGCIGGYPDQVTRQLLADRLRYLPAVLRFRAGFGYNNFMYMVLGHLTEVLNQEPWEVSLVTKLLEPLGMDMSKPIERSDDVLEDDMAKPYIYRSGEFMPGTRGVYRIHPVEPAGSILSNAADMAKWMRFNLRLGKTEDEKTLIDETFFSEAFESKIGVPMFAFGYDLRKPQYPINDLSTGYGYGWFTSTYRDHLRYWHSGGIFAYVSHVWLYPDEQIGIFGNVNGPATHQEPGYALRAILSYISDLLLGLDPWLNQETGCNFPRAWVNESFFNPPTPSTPAPYEAEEYTGTFAGYLLPNMTISRGDGDVLGFEWGRLYGVLHPTTQADHFKMEFTGFFEYAMEKAVNENFTIMYDVQFDRPEVGGSVQGFTFTYDGSRVKMFRNFDFLKGEYYQSSRAALIQPRFVWFAMVTFVWSSYLLLLRCN